MVFVVVAAVRRFLIRLSSDGEASDWGFSIGFGLDLFLFSLVEAISVGSSPFVIGVVFPVVLIPKKCVIRPLGEGIDGIDVLGVM